jgi:hypothetical protein
VRYELNIYIVFRRNSVLQWLSLCGRRTKVFPARYELNIYIVFRRNSFLEGLSFCGHRTKVFSVRYELNIYIVFRRNSVLQGLSFCGRRTKERSTRSRAALARGRYLRAGSGWVLLGNRCGRMYLTGLPETFSPGR